MVKHLVVPVDGSSTSWRAFDVALALAERAGGDIGIVEVAGHPADGRDANERLQEELQDRGPFAVDVTVEVRLASDSVADEIVKAVAHRPDSTIVMSSHGRGRSAAIIGSVTEDLLHRSFAAVVLVGPLVHETDFGGPVIVSVDGSVESEVALPLASAWASELGTTPWIVHVAPTSIASEVGGNDVMETAYPARLARDLGAFSGRAVEFDELHDRHPGDAVPAYATRHGASMIVASSHGRSGLSRLAMGSVTADFVRHATCPVTVIRVPQSTETAAPERVWAG